MFIRPHAGLSGLLCALLAVALCGCGDGGRDQVLFHSASAGDMSSVMRLIEKGADVNARNSQGFTPLHLANSPSMALLLIEQGADPNALNNYGQTPLSLAIRRDDMHLVNLLLARGAMPTDGANPLVDVPNEKLAAKLIESGAGVNVPDTNGLSPLHAAAGRGRLNVAQLLLEHGADPNLEDHFRGSTALHHAMVLVQADMARLLVEHGASVNARNRDGITPLQVAARNGIVATTRFLLLEGADPVTQNNFGESAYDMAVASGNWRVEALVRQAVLAWPSLPGEPYALANTPGGSLSAYLDSLFMRRMVQLGMAMSAQPEG